MEYSSSTTSAISRPRVSMVIITAAATASIGYFLYQAFREQPSAGGYLSPVPGPGLHRSNAVRRRRRSTAADEPADEHRDSDGSEYTSAEDSAVGAPGWPSSPTPRPLRTNNTIAPPPPEEQLSEGWAEPVGDYTQLPPSQRAGQNIVSLLFRVSEDNARRNAYVHRGCACNACGIVPIRGIRYRCANCADFDLCETCESQGLHIKTHIFYKVKVPAPPFGPRQMQPVWYPGDPDSCIRNLPRQLMAKLSRETGFERPELEAFWEQWTFLANTEWRDDPDELCLAMDRRTFGRCLVPSGGYRHTAPNLIHERMFSFYDTNNDDLIGFTEFLRGLSYRKRKDKLRRIFDGYDMDRDGLVSRRDFLRIFRAYYVLYKQMHRDILEGLDDQVMSSTEAHQLVTSRQPLSSLFGREGRVPQADQDRPMEGKVFHSNGDVTLTDRKHRVVNEDKADTQGRDDLLYSLFQRSEGHGLFSEDIFTPASENPRSPNGESDSRYLNGLLNPPAHVEGLQPLLAGQPSAADLAMINSMFGSRGTENQHPSGQGVQNGGDGDNDDDDDDDDDDDEDDDDDADTSSDLEDQENRGVLTVSSAADAGAGAQQSPAEQRAPSNTPAVAEDFRAIAPTPTFANTLPTLSLRSVDQAMRESSRRYAMERRSRVEARRKLFDRWKRRQFYVDEEEGALPPEGWDDDEDVLIRPNGSAAAEGSKAPRHHQPLSPRSRSSSKVRFAEDTDDYEVRSNPSTSSRSVPERWGGMEIPDAERDTGKEILYQVTQQAFNELLDILFKAKEDQAIEAAKTKALRERYREQIQAISREEAEGSEGHSWQFGSPRVENKPARDRTLEELLDASGYAVDRDGPNGISQGQQSSNPVELDIVEVLLDGSFSKDNASGGDGHGEHAMSTSPMAEFCRDVVADEVDPTMPQFRPNSSRFETPDSRPPASDEAENAAMLDPDQTPTRAATSDAPRKKKEPPEGLRWQLVAWKKLDLAEEEAKSRGGWGKLDFDEFEKICHEEEDQKNRLDYLGSWIDFCIP